MSEQTKHKKPTKAEEVPTINNQWNEFERLTGLVNSPEFVRREMKRAFFVGNEIMLNTLVWYIGALSDDEAEKAMMSLHKQIAGFNEAVKLGAA